MKKTLKKIWGIGLVVVLLSSLFVVAAPASAGNYAFTNTGNLPSTVTGPLAPVTSYAYAAAVTVAITDGGDAAAETLTFNYVDQSGNAGNTATAVVPLSAAVGTAVAITLATGDTGIQDITAASNVDVTVDATAGAFTIVGADGTTVMATISFAAGASALADGAVNPLANSFGIYDVAQSGSTIWAVGEGNAGTDYIYRSTNDGASWAKVTPTIAPTAGTWGLVAVAPDDPNVVAIVDTAPATDVVYLSTNGGVTFSALTALTTNAVINAISISPQGIYRYIAVGGHTTAPAVGSGGAYLVNWAMGMVAPAWSTPGSVALPTLLDDVEALQYSTNWLADQSLLVVTETVGGGGTAGNVALRVFSYNTNTWDASVDISFPRILESDAAGAGLTCARADIALDAAFFLGDEALQIGFVGAQIYSPGTTEVGGVYRIGTYTVSGGVYSLTQIMSGTAINSVAWDGSNLLAAQYGSFTTGIPIWRCGNALASTGWLVQPNSTFKTPGTGSGAMVLFAGEAGYAFSQGNNSAVAKTTDLGKSFNGIALVNSNFNNMLDFWVSPDGAVTHALTDDGVDINLWRKSGGTWERVFILAGQTGTTWLVRADAGNPDTVFLGKKGAKNMYYSVDGGDTSWTVRSCSQTIIDFAVQDKDILYVAASGTPNVAKSSNGGFTWGAAVNTGISVYGGGNCYSISLLADNQLLVGGTTGGVAYSADGAATFTAIPKAITSGQTLVAATGLATDDFIFAASSGGDISSWKIGTNTTLWTAGATTNNAATGLAFVSGTLYVLDDTTNIVSRFLTPTITIAAATDTIATGTIISDQTNMVNALQATTGSTTLWARDAVVGGADTLNSYTEYFTSAATAPTPTYPINNAKIPVNSLSGVVNNFVFQWSSPPAISTTQAYDYNLEIYLDEAGLVPVAGSPTTAVLSGATIAGGLSIAANAGTVGFAGVPGETYYWRVRTDAGFPLQSYWSAMQSFTIQQMTAIVPIVSSPQNGAEVDTETPGFSWSPIAGATKYKFELSTNAAFVSTVYSTEVLSAGAQLPTTIKLERGKQYFWRVKALEPSEGEWSTVANFLVAELPPEAPPPVEIKEVPAPVINIPAAPPAQEVILQPPAEEVIAPAYIWAIIIIGAVLVIAVIVLIVRTRRSV